MDEQCFGDPHHRRKIINGICRKLLVLQSKNVAPRLYFAGIECQSSNEGIRLLLCLGLYAVGLLALCFHRDATFIIGSQRSRGVCVWIWWKDRHSLPGLVPSLNQGSLRGNSFSVSLCFHSSPFTAPPRQGPSS